MGIIKVNGSALYQWDTDRSVEITPWQNYTVDEVHFMNPNSDSALVVDPVVKDGEVIAPIPNILLQAAINIRVFAVMHTESGERTVSDCTFGVNARQKPSDYVYTETEVRTYEALAERIKALEQGGGGSGEPGKDGITPHIGDNGNWFIGETDTGKPSSGDGLSTAEKSLILTIFENAAYINPDMGGTLQQLKKLWSDGTEEPSIPEKALAYWDYTMGDIRDHDSFSVNAYSPADASFTMEEEGMLIVNNSKSGYAGFMTVDTFDFSTVEVTYVVRPIEILSPKDPWFGITFSIGYQNAITISTGHGVSASGAVLSDYVLPSLGEDYTIRVKNGVIYVNDTLVYSQNPTEIKSAYIGLNGTMYLKSISVVPLGE